MERYLEPYYQWTGGISTNGSNVLKLTNRRTSKLHIAYHLPGESRWRISPAMSESVADMMMRFAREDSYRGNGFPTLRHRLKTYAREIMPTIWHHHRKRMAERKMQREMGALPNFGMF